MEITTGKKRMTEGASGGALCVFASSRWFILLKMEISGPNELTLTIPGVKKSYWPAKGGTMGDKFCADHRCRNLSCPTGIAFSSDSTTELIETSSLLFKLPGED